MLQIKPRRYCAKKMWPLLAHRLKLAKQVACLVYNSQKVANAADLESPKKLLWPVLIRVPCWIVLNCYFALTYSTT